MIIGIWNFIYMVGIISYGTYIPKYRLKITEIAESWAKDPQDIIDGLGIYEKSVPGGDEDAVTIALEAASDALNHFPKDRNKIEALFVGSESHPYAVNPTSTIIGELLGIGNNYLAVDMQFACKAATTAIQNVAGLISSGQISYGLTIGTDAAQSKTHDALEYTSAAGSAAFIMGADNPAVELLSFTSYSSDTPDFWRRDGIRYPTHAGRFTGEPAYFAHVTAAATRLLKLTDTKPADYDWCVFHMPNGKFPQSVGKRLGFTKDQMVPSFIVDSIGNPYTASSLLGLASTLDQAKSGDKIFMVSYGSGAGSDAFVWRATNELPKIQKNRKAAGTTITQLINQKKYISYVEYLKQTHKI